MLFLLVALHARTGSNIAMRYFVLDHLGSVSVVTDETGAVTERLSYDAWGRHRHSDWTDDPTCASGSSTTTRGFTGQEEMDLVCDGWHAEVCMEWSQHDGQCGGAGKQARFPPAIHRIILQAPGRGLFPPSRFRTQYQVASPT